MFYNAVGAGEVAALRDLADVNIGVGALAWNIQEARGSEVRISRRSPPGSTLIFPLLD